jgi:hypothetical protein
MPISLYDASVGCYLQTLGAVSGFLEKARAHCAEHAIDLAEMTETRLFPDMLPFRYQIQSVAHHASGGAAALLHGTFSPATNHPEHDYTALQRLIADAHAELTALSTEIIEARAGADVTFRAGPREMHFTAEFFVLTFSLPNVHFHATTAYDILRSKGVPVGKRDYMGKPRFKS